jgi:large subunit ribosomal protein L29
MKMSELNDLQMEELTAKDRDMRQELFNLRLLKASSQLEKSAQIKTLRRNIARVETRMSLLRNKTKTA